MVPREFCAPCRSLCADDRSMSSRCSRPSRRASRAISGLDREGTFLAFVRSSSDKRRSYDASSHLTFTLICVVELSRGVERGACRRRPSRACASTCRRMADAGGRRSGYALQSARRDQHLECRPAGAGVPVQNRRGGRPRRSPAGRRDDDVRGLPLSEQALRARSRQAGITALGVRSSRGSAGAGQGLLRHRQSRRRLRQRQSHLQRPGQHHGCGRCDDRARRLADQARRPRDRSDHDDGAAGRGEQSVCREQRRRNGRARLHRGARSQLRPGSLACVEHRT